MREVLLFFSYERSPFSTLQTSMAGGICKYVPLTSSSDGKWEFDSAELEAAFTPKTRAIILNTPHNPTGKVSNVMCCLVYIQPGGHCQLKDVKNFGLNSWT